MTTPTAGEPEPPAGSIAPPPGYTAPPPGYAAPPPGYPPPPGYAGPPPGYAGPPSAPAGKPPVRAWDVAVTVILLVLDGGLALLMSFFGFFLAMASDPCGVRDCNSELIAIGMMVAVGLPWIVLIVTAIVAIVLLVRRRIAFWVPLVGAVFIIGSWFVGAVIAGAGVPSS